jgi:hypothetical protein
MAGIESPTTGNGLEIDTGFRAARVAVRPPETGGWHSISAQSGALTATGAAVTAFSLRNLSAKLILVRRIGIGLIVTTGFTAAQKLDVALLAARGFTTSDSGGTAIAVTGSNGKHRTSLTTPTSLDCRIATTGALTAGTRTLDTLPLAQQAGWALAATAGVVIAPAPANLLSHDTGDYPLVLAQNEGLVLTLPTAFSAGGIANLIVNLEFAETDSF